MYTCIYINLHDYRCIYTYVHTCTCPSKSIRIMVPSVTHATRCTTRCNTSQHASTHFSQQQHASHGALCDRCNKLRYTLQHNATHCNTLHHTSPSKSSWFLLLSLSQEFVGHGALISTGNKVHRYTCIHAHTHARTHAHARTQTHTRIDTCTDIDTHIFTHSYTRLSRPEHVRHGALSNTRNKVRCTLQHITTHLAQQVHAGYGANRDTHIEVHRTMQHTTTNYNTPRPSRGWCPP